MIYTDAKRAECFPPGAFIREELEARGVAADNMTDYLAQELFVSRKMAEQLLRGARPLLNGEALRLGELFGTGPVLWVNLDEAWGSWLHCKLALQSPPHTDTR